MYVCGCVFVFLLNNKGTGVFLRVRVHVCLSVGVFLSQELRSLRAKLRPRRHSDQVKYKPAVGRDTNTGPLVTTKVHTH